MNPVPPGKLQHVYSKHAADFGITGPWNPASGAAFEQALRDHVNHPLRDHVNHPAITPIIGTYRGTLAVTHYYDPASHGNVMVDSSNNLVGAWKPSVGRAAHLLASGNIQ